jgi:transcriptional regulator with XRE-family HTH domain
MRDARRIQVLLEARGLSLEEAAGLIGMSPRGLARIFSGSRRPNPGQEDRIRALVGYQPLRACPTCQGYGRVGRSATEVDPVENLERIRRQVHMVNEKAAGHRMVIHQQADELDVLLSAVNEAVDATDLADAKDVLVEALHDVARQREDRKADES